LLKWEDSEDLLKGGETRDFDEPARETLFGIEIGLLRLETLFNEEETLDARGSEMTFESICF
jgi:hypothetical protein